MAFEAIAARIGEATGEPFMASSKTGAHGGCINEACTLRDGDRSYFVKINGASTLPMFEAEAEALREMAETRTVRVPLPVVSGTEGGKAFLAMEAITFGRAAHGADREMGRQLARMHRATGPAFGWTRDNTIGTTPQPNPLTESWTAFYREHRLRHQFELAKGNGLSVRGADALMDRLPEFFDGYDPAPSLLHGDLWGGNAGFDHEGQPVIYDPATYYGDRETDLAFTELFGGFSSAFYGGYNEEWPLDPGHARRKALYNLYHILNHFNIFGGGYGSQAQSMVASLLR